MTTYNHAYTVAFAVSGANHSDPYQTLENEVDKVIDALLKRVAELAANKTEYLEALEAFDTYEED
jgi:hypothetical protein